MLIKPCGETAILIDLNDADGNPLTAAMRLREAIDVACATGHLVGITEVIPAAATLLIHLDPTIMPAAEIAEIITHLDLSPFLAQTTQRTSLIEIPVSYNGPDLESLANHLGIAPKRLIQLHGELQWTAAFGGFAPGFMYLVCEEFPFTVPRLESPRAAIPAGSVALAGSFSAVYPQQSPGGWQLIGHTDLLMWNTKRRNPSLIQPGDTVRFSNLTR